MSSLERAASSSSVDSDDDVSSRRMHTSFERRTALITILQLRLTLTHNDDSVL